MPVTQRRAASLVALAGILACAGLLAGCKGDAQLSQKELQQFQAGPPKEMPPQARAMYEQAMRQGARPASGHASAPRPAAGR